MYKEATVTTTTTTTEITHSNQFLIEGVDISTGRNLIPLRG